MTVAYLRQPDARFGSVSVGRLSLRERRPTETLPTVRMVLGAKPAPGERGGGRNMEDTIGKLYDSVRREIAKVIVGQDEVIEQLLVCLFAGGHVLLEGIPGTAKTLLVRVVARLFDCQFKRIQFTPDLMPADLIGTNIFDPQQHSFQFRPGPLFAQLILGDEINRAPAKTQA